MSPVEPLWDQTQYRDGKLPIDRLRRGDMTDSEVLRVAAETLRYHAGPTDLAREQFEALANRLLLVRLLNPHQTPTAPAPDAGAVG